jgi:hypothetical protein
MAFRNRLLVVALLGALLFLFTIWSVPFVVSNGLRAWIWWKARQERLTVKIDRIEAPFLRPVVMRGFHILSAHDAAVHTEVNAARITVDLSLKTILLHTSGRAIRTLSADALRMEIRCSNAATPSLTERGWRTLQKLLPGSFNVERFDLRVETGRTVVLLRNVSVSGNEIESGRFGTDQVTIVSPWFRQTFSQLRGATKWEDNRFTLAGLSLTRGLDLPSATSDLSHLARQNIGLEFDIEVFGGKLRADISHDWRSDGANWNLVGSATDISLAQTAEAIGSAEQVGGLLHACKFSFRGNLLDPTRATGWLWTELTAPAWRERAANVVMLGATLSNQQVEIEQLYVKQGKNELTLSGEASFPTNSFEWLNSDFRGDISASIANLGDFARLFGANRGDFAGAIAVEGTVKARERKVGGHLTAAGSALTLFKKPVDLLKAKMNLRGTQLGIEQLELARGQDFLRAQGKIDIRHGYDSRGTLALSIRTISDYAPNGLLASSLTAQLVFDGRLASIESLQLQDGPLGIGFSGTIDFADLRNIGITLIPAQALFDLGWLTHVDCASALQFLPAAKTERFLPEIEKIDLRGDLFAGPWHIALRKDAGPDQEWTLCTGSSGRSLNIAVRDRTTASFGQSALRNFRNGEHKSLSLSFDPP